MGGRQKEGKWGWIQFLAKGSQVAVKGRINTGSYTKDDGTKVYTTDILADKVEFLGSKADGQAKPSGNSNHFDEDVFTPVDDEDMDSIPFWERRFINDKWIT